MSDKLSLLSVLCNVSVGNGAYCQAELSRHSDRESANETAERIRGGLISFPGLMIGGIEVVEADHGKPLASVQMMFCMQCTDRPSGKVGTFMYLADSPFVAVSPVCVDYYELLQWLSASGYKSRGGLAWEVDRK